MQAGRDAHMTRTAVAGKESTGPHGEGEFTCEKCGRKFGYAKWYTAHALKCAGKPQTRGRIERLDARRRRHQEVDRPARKPVRAHRAAASAKASETTTGSAAPIAVSTEPERNGLLVARGMLLAELRKKRELLDAAIQGLETLG
jgi:hypothetical protein